MSDHGERTCPLCAEEMDLTDQQLKPCKCGYEICVWCWHHIMEMAEKDGTEGRCPACRAPYDKDKIVGTAAKCESLVTEISVDKKVKSHKTKTKTSEGRKQLSSVRVIQRNLVYVVGLPLTLADEDLLQRREYFGQYGKVLKVSMSRTAAGVIQQFPNSTCSVYITYSKEEEAIRCIQNVHQFVLDGKTLRACFGTTKYCHAWLRNMPCSNPDCLYLHEIGSQEDSFTKDEIISEFSRSKVQQITGAANNTHRRFGSVLPPPIDDSCSNNSASIGKTMNAGTVARGSPNGTSGRSIALPVAASWGSRVSANQLQAVSLAHPNGSSEQKLDSVSIKMPFSSAVVGTLACSLPMDAGKGSESLRSTVSLDYKSNLSDGPTTPAGGPAAETLRSHVSVPPESDEIESDISITTNSRTFTLQNGQPVRSNPGTNGDKGSGRCIKSLISNLSSLTLDGDATDEYGGVKVPDMPFSHRVSTNLPVHEGLQEHYDEQSGDTFTSLSLGGASVINGISISEENYDFRSESHKETVLSTSEGEENGFFSDKERLKDPEFLNTSPLFRSPYCNHPRANSLQQGESIRFNRGSPYGYITSSTSASSNTCDESGNGFSSTSMPSFETSSVVSIEGRGNHIDKFPVNISNADGNVVQDSGESNIISNVLSPGFDVWDDPLPHNLAKFLGGSDEDYGSLKLSSPWKTQNSSQSRFSFARQEETVNHSFETNSFIGKVPDYCNSGYDYSGGTKSLCKAGVGNSLYSTAYDSFEDYSCSYLSSSHKLPVASRAQFSAPPGFTVPCRAPPPGFSSRGRVDQGFESLYGNHSLDSSTLLRNSCQALQTGSSESTADIGFMDPAILAVGKGRQQDCLNNPGFDSRSNFPLELGAHEAELQLLMQRSLSTQHNLRFADVEHGFSHLCNPHSISSGLLEQSHVNKLSFAHLSPQLSRNGLMSNGHLDWWNEVQGTNSLATSQILRNDVVGKFYAGFEDSEYQIPSSGGIFQNSFGM